MLLVREAVISHADATRPRFAAGFSLFSANAGLRH